MAEATTEPPIEAARVAFTRHAWNEAYARFREADRARPLAAPDLAAYADAAWWSGRPRDATGVRERAYTVLVDAGEPRSAARVALRLFLDSMLRGAPTVAFAWLGRAERLLQSHEESAEYGHLRVFRGFGAGNSGDPDTAFSEGAIAVEHGRRFRDRDLEAMGLMLQGQALVTKGQVREGMALMDEATIAAVSGELSLDATGWVYCGTIGACRDRQDYRRAGEWTEAALRWCERQSVNGFPGICRVQRAEILALRGALARAEQEARLARDELARWDFAAVIGESVYEIGFIRLRMGDLPAAEEAFREAHELGRRPEPGMSLIRLAEGKAAGANAALRSVLEEERSTPERARLLPVQVEIGIAAGDLGAAEAAVRELEGIATSFESDALNASAHHARGALLLAQGDAPAAERPLRSALRIWHELDAPYEAAQTRVLIARARRAASDEDTARLELGAAKATFERIGARRDARLAASELGDTEAVTETAGPRVTRTFLFTDIVRSTDLIAAIGDDAWQGVLRWHDQALRAVIAEHGGEEIRHQGDGLVVSFAEPRRAIECAIAIQRRLADHRRTQGFAPGVRIGVHRAEATQRGLDYSGVGVHAAARVGALASDGEILVSRETLEASDGAFAADPPRLVELKGIPEPLEVSAVAWR